VPIYGYRCSNCGHQFETLQSFSAERKTVCPKCQGKLTRLFYPAGVIFKGSGFYSTDYKGSEKSESSNGSGSASESSSESKSETKPESKSETKPESESKTKPESKSESSD
jgi:putative FmdB family regulatory protein